MKLIIPVESIVQKKGGVILYDPYENKILKQYVHTKKWEYSRVGWRGGCLYKSYLIATDWTDIHYFNINKWKYAKTFKKSTFNDLHYVDVHNDKLYVVNTGLDAIEIFNNPVEPEFEKMIFVFKKNKKLFGQNRDIDLEIKYNNLFKIKPHLCHPNCICFIKNKIFVTCFGKKQRNNTGEIIELNSGKPVSKRKFDCHDGNIYKGDLYVTRTRHAQILKFKDILNQEKPTTPSESFKIKKPGWWRGMVIYDDVAYVFASDGYRGRKTTARMARVDLKTSKVNMSKLPSVDNIYWDTIYEPNILEE